MLVFGGGENKQGFVYALDLTDMNWNRIKNVQYNREAHSANLIGDSIYLFGGYVRRTNDIHKYDIKQKTFQKVDTTGNIPSKRYGHGSAVIEEKLYIFGGDVWTDPDTTLYSLNTNSNEWETISIASDFLPPPLEYPSMFSLKNNLYLFGGYN